MVCGPNSFCVTDNHNMNCICNAGHSGDPNDLDRGCEPDKSCSAAKDCPAGTMCQVNSGQTNRNCFGSVSADISAEILIWFWPFGYVHFR